MTESGVLPAVGTMPLVDGGVLLPGAVPLADTEEVFRAMSLALGHQLERLPDGAGGCELPRLRLRPGITASSADIGPLGFSEAALRSYQSFAFLRSTGVIPHHCRFQVSLPTPLSAVARFVDDRDRSDMEAFDEAGLLDELEIITTCIPSDQLAVQWNAGVELSIIEGHLPAHFADAERGVLERLVHLADMVPSEIELGFHFCRRPRRLDMEHAPSNGRDLTRLAAALLTGARRSVDWLHLPVPEDRIDMRFFELVAGMPLEPSTSLYLGLIHGDGLLGAEARIVAAQRFIPHFGVATACGWTTAGPTVDELLWLHRSVTMPAGSAAVGV